MTGRELTKLSCFSNAKNKPVENIMKTMQAISDRSPDREITPITGNQYFFFLTAEPPGSVSSVKYLRTGGCWFETPAKPIFFQRINDSHCDMIHSSLTAVHFFSDGNVGKQPHTTITGLERILFGWLVALRFNPTSTAKVISWQSVTPMHFLAISHQY